MDLADYRRALGSFATGVAVITTLDENGENVGITVNSFNSVSLTPPLVLWSISSSSRSYAAFVAAEHFAVNILATQQQEICERFASRTDDKFAGLNCAKGKTGVPILEEFSAAFECKTEQIVEGGDHKIIIGRVIGFEDRQTDPLIVYRGHYMD